MTNTDTATDLPDFCSDTEPCGHPACDLCQAMDTDTEGEWD